MDKQDTITIKAFLQRPVSYHAEIRRIPLTPASGDMRGLFEQLSSQVVSSFPGLRDLEADLTVTWRDSDGDYVLMTSDEELLDAIKSEAKNKQLNIYITVETPGQTAPVESDPFIVLNQQGYKEVEAEGLMEAPDAQTPPQQQSTTTANNNEVDSQQVEGSDHLTTAAPTGTQCPAPGPHHLPPSPFSYYWGLLPGAGRWSGRGRQCGFPGPSWRRGHLQGGPLHPDGHGHFPWAHQHHQPMWHAAHPSRGFGRPMGTGMRRGVIGHGTPFQPQGFVGLCGRRGERSEGEGRTWTAASAADGPCATGRAGPRALHAQVPFEQRRWARGYIQQWRQKHLDKETPSPASATTSTGTNKGGDGEKDRKMSMEAAHVTQAYADWLGATLPRFHERVGQAAASAASVEDLIDAEAPVPISFQKWCLWFLTWQKKCGNPRGRHGGLRVSFRGHETTPSYTRDEYKKECKAIRKGIKQTNVPLKYRIWAKSYIRQWRRDHGISSHNDDVTSSSTSSSSESEDVEKTLSEVIDIPENYRMWLNRFLTRCHAKRGDKVQDEAKATTVPFNFNDESFNEFRSWAKLYISRQDIKKAKKDKHHRHHHHHNPHQHGHRRMYKKWMREQYRKWLEYAGQAAWVSSDSSSSSSSSSDEDADDKQMASSFKRLSLDQPKDTNTGSDGQQTARSDDSISDPARTSSDPLSEGNQTDDAIENIPPQMQQLMTKMMVKMQAKQMKMAQKAAAKRDMKAAWKAHKFSY